MNNNNFNEEIFEELSVFGFEGKLVEIADEDKGLDQDYLDLETRLLLADMETTRMIRESSRNARLGLPCGVSMAEQAVKMRQKLTKSNYGVDDLQRLYIKTPLTGYFENDNIFQCDTSSVSHCLRKVSHRKPKV